MSAKYVWRSFRLHCQFKSILLITIAVFCVCPAASYGAYPICKGCSVCSRDNGCVNCQPKLFLFLRRERMRQYGECLHDCPAGYYGMRSPELNMCSSKSSRVSPTQLPSHFTSTPQSPTPLTFTSFSQHTLHRHTYTLHRLLLSHNT